MHNHIDKMEASSVNSLIKLILLHQRIVNYQFKLETGLNRSHLEILAFADEVVSFNAYEAQKRFKQMNLQQVRITIKNLVDIKAIERLNVGVKNGPAVYIINKKGKKTLDNFYQSWYNIVTPS